MRDSTKCIKHEEDPNITESHAVNDSQTQPSRASTWRSRIRAVTDSFAYPLPPSNVSNEAPRRRRYYVYPRAASEMYMPSGPLDKASGRPTSHHRPEASSNPAFDLRPSHERPQALSNGASNHPQEPSNPFEDPQYEYGATLSKGRPMREWQDVLEDQRSPSATKRTYVKAFIGRQRSRVQAAFTSAKTTEYKHQERARSSLLKGQGTHLERNTMRRPRCPDCQREAEAKSLVR